MRLVERAAPTIPSSGHQTIHRSRIEGWEYPAFQRPYRFSNKVKRYRDEVKRTGAVTGTVVIGIWQGRAFVIDGQHRLRAALETDHEQFWAFLKVDDYETWEGMAAEFQRLNSSLTSMRPDDVLRSKEQQGNNPLATIRELCPYIGYDRVRRSGNSPILSMSLVLRCWHNSQREIPLSNSVKAADVIDGMSHDDAFLMCHVVSIFMDAWGRDKEYQRLWSTLNLTICMWLWRNCVRSKHTRRTTKLSTDEFRKCMASLSSDPTYLEWLHGRNHNQDHLSPCYRRIKELASRRYKAETGSKATLPNPEWSS